MVPHSSSSARAIRGLLSITRAGGCPPGSAVILDGPACLRERIGVHLVWWNPARGGLLAQSN